MGYAIGHLPLLCVDQSVFLEVYLVIIVVTCYFRPLEGAAPVGKVHLIHFTPGFVTTLPVQVFAYTCAQNVSHTFPLILPRC